jgi:hypothetical protein
VAGGVGGLSPLVHALSARRAAVTRLSTTIREAPNLVWSLYSYFALFHEGKSVFIFS